MLLPAIPPDTCCHLYSSLNMLLLADRQQYCEGNSRGNLQDKDAVWRCCDCEQDQAALLHEAYQRGKGKSAYLASIHGPSVHNTGEG